MLARLARHADRQQSPRGWLWGVPIFLVLLVVAATAPRTAGAQGPPPPVCNPNCYGPPTVTITPSSETVPTQALSVTVDWCDTLSFIAASQTLTFNGANVLPNFTFTSASGYNGCHVHYQSVGKVPVLPGNNTLAASIQSNAGGTVQTGSASATYSVPTYHDTVTAAATLLTPSAGGGSYAAFTVKNLGSATDTFTVTSSCSGAALPPMCPTPSKSPLIVAQSASGADTVYFTAGGSGTTGFVTLIAASLTHGESNSATTRVEIGRPQGLDVSVNSGATVERSLCLTIAVSQNAAYECGDLRIVHPLPSARTYNKLRVPTLLYRTHLLWTAPTISALLTTPSTGNKPDSVTASFKVRPSGTSNSYTARTVGAHWYGSDFADGTTMRIAVGPDMHSDSTGLYDYILTTTRWYSGVADNDSASGQVPLVNREYSYFGTGWWLAGLERIIATGTGFFWIGGDGSTRLYSLAHDSVYTTPLLTSPDSLVKHGSGQYVRYAPHGLGIIFNLSGQHVATVDRFGHGTNFTYDGQSRLTRVSLPVPTASDSIIYKLVYNTTSGPLDTIHQVRRGDSTVFLRTVALADSTPTSLDPSANVVKRIMDPDGQTVAFTYDPALPVRIHVRTDKKGTPAVFTSGGVALDRAGIAIASGDSLIRSFNNVDEAGFSAGWEGGPQHAAIPDSAEDIYYGPNFEAGGDSDITHFWLDPYGEPTRIVDAYRNETDLGRDNTTFLAAVTQKRAANGQLVTAGYDAAGNLNTTTDQTTLLNGQHPTTNYTYRQHWNFVAKIDPPLHDSTTFTYDTVGNRITETNATGSSSTITFNYNGETGCDLVTSIVLPGTAKDTLMYDAGRCNLLAEQSPRGLWTLYHTDSLGRTTLVVSPRDSAHAADTTDLQTTGVFTYHAYDSMDRVTEDSTKASSDTVAPAQALYVAYQYDANGGLTQVTRSTKPDTAHVGNLVTQTVFDAAERPVHTIATNNVEDTTAYDAAGNVITYTNRRGEAISSAYDKLNRLVQRIVDTAAYNSTWKDSIPAYTFLSMSDPADTNPPYGNVQFPADTQTFGYDPVGDMVFANNAYAEISRTYRLNGLLQTDTLRIRTRTTRDSTVHVYGLAFGYDQDGRRDTVAVPLIFLTATNGFVNPFETYAYDAAGRMRSAVDPLGHTFHYGYTARGDPDTLTFGNPASDSATRVRSYDADGNLATETTIQFVPSLDTVRVVTVTHDGRGKILKAANTKGIQDVLVAHYAGLGPLVSDTTTFTGTVWGFTSGTHIDKEYFTTDGFGNAISTYSVDSEVGDPLGNATHYEFATSSYKDSTGQLLVSVQQIGNSERDTTLYDRAENVVYQFQSATPAAGRHERASYYGADGQLRETDTRTAGGHGGMNTFTRALEQYYYDALGRRVLVWTQAWCYNYVSSPAICYHLQLGTMRRTIWDGTQELGEIQVQDSLLDSASVDTVHVKLPISSAGTWDNNRFFGRALYTHGNETDLPLSVTRIDYADSTLTDSTTAAPYLLYPPQSVVPLWNYHGQADWGLVGPCPTVSGHVRCISNPGQLSFFAYAQTPDVRPSWEGQLLQNKLDGSGNLYRRARYYDPVAGRFTQEDPIGLAGGLNAYGFANGDPINYSDPFGLCPNPDGSPCFSAATAFAGLIQGMRLAKTAGPLIAAATALATAPLTLGGDAAGLGVSATSTFYRGVSAAEAADITATGGLRAAGGAEGTGIKYLTNTAEAAGKWNAVLGNGADARIIAITVPRDVTSTFTSLGRIDGIGQAWTASVEALKNAQLEFLSLTPK